MKHENSLGLKAKEIDLIQKYFLMLNHWNNAISLMSKEAIANFWNVHVPNSLRLHPGFIKNKWLDMGSGNGVPGIIVSITHPELERIVLVDSDKRKCAFLRAVSRELNLDIDVSDSRIEELDCMSVDIISAQAFAPISRILKFGSYHLNNSGKILLIKGKNWEREHEEAAKIWDYDLTIQKNSHGDTFFLNISNVSAK